MEKESPKLLITYQDGEHEIADYLFQEEIATTKEWISQVLKVEILNNGKIFTGDAARRFISNLNDENRENKSLI